MKNGLGGLVSRILKCFLFVLMVLGLGGCEVTKYQDVTTKDLLSEYNTVITKNKNLENQLNNLNVQKEETEIALLNCKNQLSYDNEQAKDMIQFMQKELDEAKNEGVNRRNNLINCIDESVTLEEAQYCIVRF